MSENYDYLKKFYPSLKVELYGKDAKIYLYNNLIFSTNSIHASDNVAVFIGGMRITHELQENKLKKYLEIIDNQINK